MPNGISLAIESLPGFKSAIMSSCGGPDLTHQHTGTSPGVRPANDRRRYNTANERRRYIVTTSLIGWAHTQVYQPMRDVVTL